MFIRKKKMRNKLYYQLAESKREGKKVKQRILATLGTVESFIANGTCDSLIRSCASVSEKIAVLSDLEKDQIDASPSKSIGASLVFERLWIELGIRETIQRVISERQFDIDLERAIFLTVLHRIVCSGSDRAAEYWKDSIELRGTEHILLHHLYRAMHFLGEIIDDGERTNKERIEEELFASRADLFASLDLVFFDTTSIYFYGIGGETLGERGFNKDGKSDCPQLILGLLVDKEGMPICTEILPGNTTDVRLLVPVIDRLRKRFPIDSVSIVADRGMISEFTVRELEKMKVSYIVGVRMRQHKDAMNAVLTDIRPFEQVQQEAGKTPLAVKDVTHEGVRYIVCRNDEQATYDKNSREAIVEHLMQALKKGDKQLISNSGYKRYLKMKGKAFAIDPEKIQKEAQYDGLYVLRTNLTLSADEIALHYKQLWRCEQSFRKIKSVFDTRPIYHKTDEGIVGHVFCSFLALKLEHELMKKLSLKGKEVEWDRVLQDLVQLRIMDLTSNGKKYRIRSEIQGACGLAFQAVGVAIPPTIRQIKVTSDL